MQELTSAEVFSHHIYDSYGRLQEIRGREDVKTQLFYHVTSGSNSTDRVQHVRRWKAGTGWQNVETLSYDSAGRISLRTRIGGRTKRFLNNNHSILFKTVTHVLV